MKYIEKRLFDDEDVIFCGDFPGIHKFWAWAALVVLGILVIGIVIFIRMMVHFQTTEFCVTSRRVILKKGLFTADMMEMELDALEGAHIHQSFWGRLFGYGRIEVRGRGNDDIQFPPMTKPGEFVAAIEEARMNAQAAPMETLADEIKPGGTD